MGFREGRARGWGQREAGGNIKMEGGGEDQWDIALGRGFGRHAGISRYGDLEMREITEGMERRDKRHG